MNQSKKEILAAAAEQRRQDVLHYQINIDNYRAAIAEIDENYPDDENLLDFRNKLEALLISSLNEQAKEKIMLTVIEKQLGDEE